MLPRMQSCQAVSNQVHKAKFEDETYFIPSATNRPLPNTVHTCTCAEMRHAALVIFKKRQDPDSLQTLD